MKKFILLLMCSTLFTGCMSQMMQMQMDQAKAIQESQIKMLESQSNDDRDYQTASILSDYYLIIDDIIFDESELPRLTDSNGNIIAFFDRFENKSLPQVDGIKIYNGKNEHLYSLIPSMNQSTFQIHIKDIKSEKRSLIESKAEISGFNINNIYSITGLDEGFSINESMINNITSVEMEQSVLFNSKVFLYRSIKVSMNGANETKLLADEEFVLKNKIKTSIFALSLKLIEDTNRAFQTANNGHKYNHDGTINNNINPADSL